MERVLGFVEPSAADREMIVDPSQVSAKDVYKLLIGSIVPRPIAWVSTISPEGQHNLAPFSFFNAVCGEPPMVAVSVSFRQPGKDTYINVQATGEFVVNIVSEQVAQHMNLTSGEYPHGIDEFRIGNVTPVPSEAVRPPRVKESPVSMECKLVQIVELSQKPGGGSLIIGQVVRFHVDDAIVDNLRIDPDKLQAIGRMGGNDYSRTRDRFEMIRPKV
jgi:flavin reductase (DIM6/NTAB) family NADH-FMN oxidoreductase RutF